MGKQTRSQHKSIEHLVTSKCLELIHMDLVSPVQTESIAGKRYIYVCLDDYSRFAWVDFIREKSDTFHVVKNLVIRVQNEKNCED